MTESEKIAYNTGYAEGYNTGFRLARKKHDREYFIMKYTNQALTVIIGIDVIFWFAHYIVGIG